MEVYTSIFLTWVVRLIVELQPELIGNSYFVTLWLAAMFRESASPY